MRFRIYQLRRRGRRLPWPEVKNGPSYVGDLRSHTADHNGERYHVMHLVPDDGPMALGIIELYEPTLLSFAPLAFRVRGFERVEDGDGGYGVVQEWHCEAP